MLKKHHYHVGTTIVSGHSQTFDLFACRLEMLEDLSVILTQTQWSDTIFCTDQNRPVQFCPVLNIKFGIISPNLDFYEILCLNWRASMSRCEVTIELSNKSALNILMVSPCRDKLEVVTEICSSRPDCLKLN